MFTKLPTLVKAKSGWTLDGFDPSQAAFAFDRLQHKNATLYILQCGEFLKIGVTKDLVRRVAEIDAMNPLPVTVIAKRAIPLAALLITEAWLHQRFASMRVKGEWFSLSIEKAVGALPDAERFARAYSRCCRDWFARELVRQINEGAR